MDMETETNSKNNKVLNRQPKTANWALLGNIDPYVFIISALLAVGFLLWGVVDSEGLSHVSNTILDYIIQQWGWLFIVGILFFLLFCLYLAFSRYGDIKLGGQDTLPEYSTFSWFAMLFGCGMGVGLVFWSIAEPINHFLNPPAYVNALSPSQSAEWSLAISFFHWGLSAWASFVLIGLAMGVIIFRNKMPMLLSSCFYPLLGDRIYGPIGKLIDIITLWASLFGMTTTIGLGTKQLAAGITYNYGIPQGIPLLLGILAIVIICYLISACTPNLKGIKIGSDLSLIATGGLLLFVFLFGPTKFIMDMFVNSTGVYIQNFFAMSLWTDPIEQSGWLGSWTIFYWAWWIAWAPFVGMFIAKISKGRTIKEFVLGALIAPTLLDMIFFSIFGGTSLSFELNQVSQGILANAINVDISSAVFVLFEQFPFREITSLILIFVIFTFFVVSADSCTIVLGMLSSGGNENPKIPLKLFWGIAMGAAAGLLLMLGDGGLDALQMASILGGFPFLFIMFAVCYSIIKTLRREKSTNLVGIRERN